ncbi:hypothetical protein SISNIDRAFT_470835 [Sistotremastrum niveocremeum HHB9708]|uniref:Uncharacterized protein n=1 Tax=Sistotremastrum niveocremeum HHB9708 TaxID=1314777 RepID=A0A164NCI7_9AGAM|nr:hypothetical protein SISNIDRAFT_470835 [Sistotremastrum niveocremeum HHB9708]
MPKKFLCKFCNFGSDTTQGFNYHRRNTACAKRYDASAQPRPEHTTSVEERPHELDTGGPPSDSDVMNDAMDVDPFVYSPAITGGLPPFTVTNSAPDTTGTAAPGNATPDPAQDATPPEVPKSRTIRVEPYHSMAGSPIERAKSKFMKRRWRERKARETAYGSMKLPDNWSLAKWLILSGASSAKRDEFLKMGIIRDNLDLPFKNDKQLLEHIDDLPEGPAWHHHNIKVNGTKLDDRGKLMTEDVELWFRPIKKCIKELIGAPHLREHTRYAPEKHFDEETGERIYDEMYSTDEFAELQSQFPLGATVAPLIFSSDKTQLSTHSGDKAAWPLYLSLGTTDKAERRKPSQHAHILVGYLPVAKLRCFKTAQERRERGWELFHESMRLILEPLYNLKTDTLTDGFPMACADGKVRYVFPVVWAYIADFPEQSLVTATLSSRCPKCKVPDKQRGSSTPFDPRDPEDTLRALHAFAAAETPQEIEAASKQMDILGLRSVLKPFWEGLPFCNVHNIIAPDILHQLHKGVFKDHLVKWCVQYLKDKTKTSDEIDARFTRVPGFPGLRDFKGGISHVKQWTGNEYKAMEKYFLPLIADIPEHKVVRAARAVLDFIYYARLEQHTDNTLAAMQLALDEFHANKDEFIRLRLCKSFDIPKLHGMQHYIQFIRTHGAADGYNTETSERLHIDFAKLGYRASNKRNYINQMTKWLDRQESVFKMNVYLQWRAQEGSPHKCDLGHIFSLGHTEILGLGQWDTRFISVTCHRGRDTSLLEHSIDTDPATTRPNTASARRYQLKKAAIPYHLTTDHHQMALTPAYPNRQVFKIIRENQAVHFIDSVSKSGYDRTLARRRRRPETGIGCRSHRNSSTGNRDRGLRS